VSTHLIPALHGRVLARELPLLQDGRRWHAIALFPNHLLHHSRTVSTLSGAGEYWLEYCRFFRADDIDDMARECRRSIPLPAEFDRRSELLKGIEHFHCPVLDVTGAHPCAVAAMPKRAYLCVILSGGRVHGRWSWHENSRARIQSTNAADRRHWNPDWIVDSNAVLCLTALAGSRAAGQKRVRRSSAGPAHRVRMDGYFWRSCFDTELKRCVTDKPVTQFVA